MMPVHEAVPTTRIGMETELKGNPQRAARIATRFRLSLLGWRGDMDAAVSVVAHLVADANLQRRPSDRILLGFEIVDETTLRIKVSDPYPVLADDRARTLDKACAQFGATVDVPPIEGSVPAIRATLRLAVPPSP